MTAIPVNDHQVNDTVDDPEPRWYSHSGPAVLHLPPTNRADDCTRLWLCHRIIDCPLIPGPPYAPASHEVLHTTHVSASRSRINATYWTIHGIAVVNAIDPEDLWPRVIALEF